MIRYVKGEVMEITHDPPRVVVLTAGGVGYLVNLPAYVSERVSSNGVSVGDEVEFHVFYSVSERQPLPLLVGFLHPDDRLFFEQFLQVEGIGPAKAASALILPVWEIARAVESEDTVALTSMPGIGSRAAQKMIATLRGKVAEFASPRRDEVDVGVSVEDADRVPMSDARSDAVNVLIDLGYRNVEAQRLVSEALRRNPDIAGDVQELLQDIFRSTATSSVA